MNDLFNLSKSLIDQGLIDPTPPNPKLPLPELKRKIGLAELQSYSVMHNGKQKMLDKIPISYSWLKEFYLGVKQEAPYRFIEYRVNKNDDWNKYSSAMQIGNAVETIICAGIEYAEHYFEITKKGRISAKENSQSLIKEDDFELARLMAAKAMTNPELQKIINHQNTEFQTSELEVFDEETGLTFSGILDLKLDGVITDIKTTETLSKFPEMITKTLHYWIQAIIHKRIFQANEFQFFVIQRTPPYLCTFYRFSPETWQELELKFWNNIIVPFYHCLENGFYPEFYYPETRWL